jgi:hypothetical protein
VVDEDVGVGGGHDVGVDAKGAAEGAGVAAAARGDVDGGVADHDDFVRRERRFGTGG